MKKITFLLITLFISFTGFSQALIQGFETPTTAFGIPSNWARFEIGSPSELWYTDGTYGSVAPHSGTKQAIILGENLGSGNSAKYYLATPLVTIPLNGQLRFWVRTKTQGDQGAVFKVKVASGALPANQTTEAAYTTTLQTYSESQISTNIAPAPIVYEEKVIDFPPATYPAGTQVYIAFVSETTQTSLFQVDDFYLDDVLVVSRCLEPGTLPTGTITSSSAVLNWSNPNPTTGLGLNTCNEWEIEIVPATQLTPTGSGITVTTNPYTATTLTIAPFAPLLPLTQYKYWVRSKCAFSGSIWAGPFTFTTAPGPPVCGGNYVDAGGLTGNYPNGVTATNGGTSVITPIVAGDAVTVIFSSFVTAESTDRMRVYNGNGTAGTLLGTFSGTLTGVNLPGPFTSSDPSGALTFVFTSDGSLNAAGWLADITCAPIPTCTKPNTLTSSAITANTASIAWTQPGNPDGSTANAWQYIALPCGSTAPTATSTGWQVAPTNPFVVTGLTAGTCYDIYVRAVCSTTDVSAWSFRPVSVTTRPGCGGPFFDPGGTSNYANNITAATGTTTICPSITGQVVTVTFNTFATESGRDLLKVYDGDTSAGTLLGTFSGTAIPGPFTAASTTGCLTFVFTSDTSLANSGWDANVTCGPRPPCAKPTTLTASAITQSTALLGWTQPANPDGSNATAWQVSAVPCGSGVPATGSSSWVNANSNPFYITGLASSTCYDYYVRAVCSSTESSLIAGPFSFNTLIINDECTGAIEIPVNQNTNCLQTVQGSLAFSTGSTNASSCDGTLDDDDVWFSFTATATSHYISLLGVNYSATPSGLKYSVFTGSCGSLTQLGGCIANSSSPANPSLDGLTVGATYYIRVYSSGTTPVTTTFEICIGTNVGTCATALPLCAIAPIIIPNNVGVPTLPNPISPYSTTSSTVGCLSTAPSPTFYYFQVPTNGNYTFFLEQSTSNTFAAGTGIDVDFVTWGPYNSNAEACASISTANAFPTGPSNGCSYSAAATETFGVNNAVAGQIYVIMITNFNGRKGFVRISQTAGPVPIECCPFGNFSYSKNFYCQNEANPTPRFISNAIAGTFSAVPATGLSINPVTGLINLATSTPGTYIVHNVIGATGTCPSDDDSWSITIAAPPSGAAINYSSSSFCVLNTAVQNITQNGTPGGVYTVAPAVGLSLNTTTGSFNPSTSTLGTYVVSYNLPQSGGCPGAISSTTVTIVLPVPTFNPAPPICVGGTSAPLPTTSLNGISGTWSPAINNSATTTYTFTPNAGQCGTTTTMTIEVGPVSPGFTQIAPICTGATLAALPTTSLNGVTGTWSPAISNTTTTTYTFTPGAGFCSTNTTMTITVNPISITPTFSVTAPICYGATIATLPTTSTNGITGTWSPALNNTATTTYTFTPDPGQCAFTATKTITVNPAFAVTVNSPSVCSGTIATVTATPSVTGTYTYTWTVPTGATNPGNVATFNPTVSGAYTVILTQLGCNSAPAIANVLISTIRTPTFAAIPTVCQNSVAPVLPTSSTNSTPITGTWNAAINTANLGSTTYTFTPAPNQCATSTTISVTIATSPIATFSYNSSAYCKTGANPVLALGVGSAAGVFTSTTGLTLNSSTGAINLSTSTPGNYTITNTIAPTASCPGAVATFAITITAAPIASFSYTGSPYCISGSNPSPTFTGGGTAGTFTSTTGLSINATTGIINLAASTPGTYVVTNTIAAANGCLQVQSTAGVTITAVATATFSYNSVTYCKSSANPVITITGTAGLFTSTPGLSLNSSTGAIDLSLSTPGNYTITNTIAAASGCNAATATFTITITAPQVATFSYTGSPYCKNAANPSPSFTGGGVAGTFTSTTGLSINATTGVINLTASLAGIYTVTNTIAASGGCLAVVATAQVVISNLPQATIAYSDTFYCYNNTGSQTVTLTGTTGGTFSATPSGLSISSISGAFNVSTSTAGTYTITYTMPATGGCPQTTATTSITIIPQINVQLSAVCNGPDFTITALPVSGSFNPANATYEWTGPNGYTFGPTSNPSIVISTPGSYISTVIVNGCRFVTSQQVDGVTCSIQKGISPNGDGDNEDFILSDVKALSIFNRYGSKVYSYGQNYTNQWHGQSESGSELPDGTYYYVITRNSGNSITGWIYINR
jgi:gliding motility-associated-like protein